MGMMWYDSTHMHHFHHFLWMPSVSNCYQKWSFTSSCKSERLSLEVRTKKSAAHFEDISSPRKVPFRSYIIEMFQVVGIIFWKILTTWTVDWSIIENHFPVLARQLHGLHLSCLYVMSCDDQWLDLDNKTSLIYIQTYEVFRQIASALS